MANQPKKTKKQNVRIKDLKPAKAVKGGLGPTDGPGMNPNYVPTGTTHYPVCPAGPFKGGQLGPDPK